MILIDVELLIFNMFLAQIPKSLDKNFWKFKKLKIAILKFWAATICLFLVESTSFLQKPFVLFEAILAVYLLWGLDFRKY